MLLFEIMCLCYNHFLQYMYILSVVVELYMKESMAKHRQQSLMVAEFLSSMTDKLVCSKVAWGSFVL